jgi:hypothetical protein
MALKVFLTNYYWEWCAGFIWKKLWKIMKLMLLKTQHTRKKSNKTYMNYSYQNLMRYSIVHTSFLKRNGSKLRTRWWINLWFILIKLFVKNILEFLLQHELLNFKQLPNVVDQRGILMLFKLIQIIQLKQNKPSHKKKNDQWQQNL